MIRKVFIVAPNHQYISMFNNHNDYLVVDCLETADLIQFTGGSDVTPSYYDEETHPQTFNNPGRDVKEKEIFDTNLRTNSIPMAGICRGGQFLHVMNGGMLYQHVDGHAIGGTHEIRDVWTDKKYQVSSTHHQMMRSGNVNDHDGMVIAVAENLCEFKEYMVGNKIVRSKEWPVYDLEVVYYFDTNSLCFQPHPEFDGVEECRSLYFKYLDEYVFSEE